MSRGFVKEDDQEEIPFVAARAYLPPNATNFVTPTGLEKLLAEKQAFVQEKENLIIPDENERRIAINYINAKLNLLNERIATAKVVELSTQPKKEVRFGAKITLKVNEEKVLQNYQIVGVDEADIADGKISFISPIARILTNKKVGDTAVLKLPNEERIFKIIAVSYS